MFRGLGVTLRRADMRACLAAPPPGPASPLSEDFQVISENRLLASINMRLPPPPSYHTLNSREVITRLLTRMINTDWGLMSLMSPEPSPHFSCSAPGVVTRPALTVTPRPLRSPRVTLHSLQFCPNLEPVIREASLSLLFCPNPGPQTCPGSLHLYPPSLPGSGPV